MSRRKFSGEMMLTPLDVLTEGNLHLQQLSVVAVVREGIDVTTPTNVIVGVAVRVPIARAVGRTHDHEVVVQPGTKAAAVETMGMKGMDLVDVRVLLLGAGMTCRTDHVRSASTTAVDDARETIADFRMINETRPHTMA